MLQRCLAGHRHCLQIKIGDWFAESILFYGGGNASLGIGHRNRADARISGTFQQQALQTRRITIHQM